MSTKTDSFDISGRAWHPERPYHDLPQLPPQAELETPAVLKACIASRAALAELKQAAYLIQNPGMLISTLPLLEARASSEIENVVTTADELFRQLEPGGDLDPATREALRYREALLEGYRVLQTRPLNAGVAVRICTRILGVDTSVRRVPGTVLGNPVTGEVVYTPPSGEGLLRRLLANWERFLHARDDLDPLVRMAVAHYQFEAIHPFTDGNGRTGRVLNSLFLVERGLLGAPILYLSRYVLAHRADYYRLLLEVTRSGAWEPWILYVLEATRETAVWTHDKIAAIRTLAAETQEYVRRALPKIYSRELVELIFERPYSRIPHVQAAGIAKRQTASRYLKELCRIGVLREEREGRRKPFVHTRLLRMLTTETNEFEAFRPAGEPAATQG